MEMRFQGKQVYSSISDLGSIPGSGRSPGEGNGNPLFPFLPGKSRGQRSLAGYSPWGRKRVRHGKKKIRHNLATKQQQQFREVKKNSLLLGMKSPDSDKIR